MLSNHLMLLFYQYKWSTDMTGFHGCSLDPLSIIKIDLKFGFFFLFIPTVTNGCFKIQIEIGP